MKKTIASLLLALFFTGCASGRFSSGVKTVQVKTTPRRATLVTAPDKSTLFTQTAQSQTQWVENWLRNAIIAQLDQSARFTSARSTVADGTIEFESLRHGLVEVSSGNYAATLAGDVLLLDRNGKTIGQRTVSASSGMIHSLREFENVKTYAEAISSAAEKIALELVTDL